MGRRFASTPEQRRQVAELLQRGLRHGRIAQLVFGDARLRGRVRRLAAQQQASEPDVPSVAELEAMSDEQLAAYVEQRLGLPPEGPSPAPAPAAVQPVDGFEKETAELEAMLQRLKRLVAEDLIDERYRPGALTEIARVGLALQQRRMFLRASELTREH